MARVRINGNGSKNTKEQRRTKLKKNRVIKAIEGSGGVVKIVAERLGCAWGSIWNYMKTADEDVLDAMKQEREYVGDIAEQTVQEVLQQRLDLSSAARTARWYLERRHKDRGFVNQQELSIGGNGTPLDVRSESLINVKTLDLPLALRKELLKAIEESKDAEEDSE